MATEILEEPTTKNLLFEVRHRITVAEYHRMADAGTCGPESRVELLEGVIVDNWIVDLNRGRLKVHSEPVGAGEAAVYTRSQILGPDDEVSLILDGREVAKFAASEILP